jgi:hypothetical protein
MIKADKKRVIIILMIIAMHAVLIMTEGCKPKDKTACLTFNVEGEELSDAEVSIDNKPIGCLEQTVIKSNGELFINGQFSATLPPGSPLIGEEDIWSGVLDSVTLNTGTYTISLSSKGKTLQINAFVSPGYHLMTYFPAEQKIKWDAEVVTAALGSPVTIKGK